MSTVTFHRIKNDINGNPRYVCHFLDLGETYAQACANANQIGGRKYTAKWFGGGIVFTSYSLDELIKAMNRFRPVPATQAIIAN